MIIPQKLQSGDEVRVIAPASSLHIVSPTVRAIADKNLAQLGLHVSIAPHAEEYDLFRSSSIQSRLADLHAAFTDPNVKGILTAIGGFSSNQLLREIDYELIAANPKVLCGYSDITALQAAIFAKTGLVTYCGPHYSTFGMLKGLEYTADYFRRCVMEAGSFEVTASPSWSDDAWYVDQEQRTFIPNEGWKVVNEGEAAGTLLGGNLCTLNLLQGTEYMPSLVGSILLVEDDELSIPRIFDRDLQSLIHLPDFGEVRGLVIGRFQKESTMDLETLELMVRNKKELRNMPVVVNADFGHTTPQFTFPIGGTGRLLAGRDGARLVIEEH